MKLSDPTIKALKYYVYLLTDPRSNNSVFYVGKGKGNRINHHLMGAMDERTKETEKIKRIREIQDAGLEVGLIVLRHGLPTEETAFEIESAIIDFVEMKNLTNIVTGHHSFERSRMSLENIKIEYEPQKAVFDEPVILIRINKQYRYDMPAEELYEATRKHWKVGERAKSIRVACAVYSGIIREVYAIDKWIPHEETGRSLFEGHIAPEQLREKYLNKTVAHVWKQGSQNPVKYMDREVK